MLSSIKKTLILTLLFGLLGCNSPLPEITTTIKPDVSVESTISTEVLVVTPAQTFTPTESCQQYISSDIWSQKSLLFYEYDNSLEVSRVWSWSKDVESPQLILETKSRGDFSLSPDSTKLAWHIYGDKTFAIYYLLAKRKSTYTWQDTWQSITGWTKDGNIAIQVDHQKIYHQGTKSSFVYFNEITQKVNTEEIILHMPGYTQDELSKDPQDGFDITDPTGSLVLYTSNEENPAKLILMDIKSGQRLWQDNAQYPFYPYPAWSPSGDFVAFMKYLDKYSILYTLSRDGKTTNKIGVLSPIPNQLYREMKWSFNDRYIYYANWMTINEGPGYIIDLETNENKEVCSKGKRFLNGYWLRDDQFAYTVTDEMPPLQYGLGELRILDIDSWSYSTIFRTTNPIVSPLDLIVLGEVPVPDQ